jgi:hypothetical protein
VTHLRHPCGDASCCAPLSNIRSLNAWRVLCLFMLCACIPSRACSQKKQAATTEISFPNYMYPYALASPNRLNLKNGDLVIFHGNRASYLRAHLHNGAYRKLYAGAGGDEVELDWVRFIRNDSGQANYAFAYYTWVSWAGSSSDSGIVQLLQLVDGHVKVTQQILFNVRGSEKAGADFDTKSNTLKIRGVHGWEHCCPTELDFIRFHFDDGLFKQVSHRKVPYE